MFFRDVWLISMKSDWYPWRMAVVRAEWLFSVKSGLFPWRLKTEEWLVIPLPSRTGCNPNLSFSFFRIHYLNQFKIIMRDINHVRNVNKNIKLNAIIKQFLVRVTIATLLTFLWQHIFARVRARHRVIYQNTPAVHKRVNSAT